MLPPDKGKRSLVAAWAGKAEKDFDLARHLVEEGCVYPEAIAFNSQQAAEKLLALPNPPTAIFAFNDRMAMGAIWTLKAAGLRVPEDIAVVGFDDIPAAAEFTPPLTSVRHSGGQTGQVAAQILFKLIEGEAVDRPEVLLPAELIIRQSS